MQARLGSGLSLSELLPKVTDFPSMQTGITRKTIQSTFLGVVYPRQRMAHSIEPRRANAGANHGNR
jgi:hypothetical protein